jgi:predicted SAM-dependent methyltransferase
MSRFLQNPIINGINKLLGGLPAKIYSLAFIKTYQQKAPEKIAQYLSTHKEKYLNMGSGFNPLTNWLNGDYNERPESVFMDGTKKLMLPDNSFNAIFSEHMIEHIHYTDANNMIKEFYRILQPGGKIRINTPDLKFLIDLYSSEKTDVQKNYIEWSAGKFIDYAPEKSDTFVINNFMRDWGHCFIYDARSLKHMLEVNGFKNVEKTQLGVTSYPIFNNVEMHGGIIPAEFNELETLVVEAEKPL